METIENLTNFSEEILGFLMSSHDNMNNEYITEY